jgi:hypothetical protein
LPASLLPASSGFAPCGAQAGRDACAPGSHSFAIRDKPLQPQRPGCSKAMVLVIPERREQSFLHPSPFVLAALLSVAA